MAREVDEVVIAACAAQFRAKDSNEAEHLAALKGLQWAPLGVVWTDNDVVLELMANARLIPQDFRDPLHHLAHRLANIGRTQDWSKLDRLWLPGEVWP